MDAIFPFLVIFFLIGNFIGFALPGSGLGHLHGQASALTNVAYELPLLCVEATVRNLAGILRPNDELFVAGVEVQAGDVFRPRGSGLDGDDDHVVRRDLGGELAGELAEVFMGPEVADAGGEMFGIA